MTRFFTMLSTAAVLVWGLPLAHACCDHEMTKEGSAECPTAKTAAAKHKQGDCPMMKSGSCAKGECDEECKKNCGGKCGGMKHGHSHGGGYHTWSDDQESAKFYIDHAKSLGLTDKQVADLQKINGEQEKREQELADNTAKLHRELAKIVEDPKASRGKIKELTADIGKARTDWMRVQIFNAQDAQAVLTDDQKAKLKEMYSESADDKSPKKSEKKK